MVKKKKVVKKSTTKRTIIQIDTKVAMDFALKVYKRFDNIIKAVVLFGSVAKETVTKKSDIDIIIFIDDCTVNWDDELIAWYRTELSKILVKERHKDKIHVNTITLSTFWDEIKYGEPLAINVIRYGEVLIDQGGFFNPLKILLAKGKIRPSPEAIFVTMERSREHILKANTGILLAVEGFYWAMVDAAHAALMAINIIPPSPEYVADLLNDFFVKKRKLDKKHVLHFEETLKVAKAIRYGDLKSVKGNRLENLEHNSIEFVNALTDIAKKIIEKEKIIKVQEKKI